MKPWRPDNWRNPRRTGEPLNWAAVNEVERHAAYEAGADAMFEAVMGVINKVDDTGLKDLFTIPEGKE